MCAEYRDQEKYKVEPEVKVKIDPMLNHPEYDVDRAALCMKDLKTHFNLNTKIKNPVRDQSIIDEKIKSQKWYFIKFITFCKAESSDFKDKPNYSPYFVLGEVRFLNYYEPLYELCKLVGELKG